MIAAQHPSRCPRPWDSFYMLSPAPGTGCRGPPCFSIITFIWAPKPHWGNFGLCTRCCPFPAAPKQGSQAGDEAGSGLTDLAAQREDWEWAQHGAGVVWSSLYPVTDGSPDCHSEVSSPCVHTNVTNPEPTCRGEWG